MLRCNMSVGCMLVTTDRDMQVVGFDMVDDESKPERRPNKHMHAANEWDLKHNPAYAYYAYYTYANLYVLKQVP